MALTIDTYTDIVTQLQRYASTLPGMRQAPAKIPETANEFPFAVTILRRGDWQIAPAGVMASLPATFATQIHLARRDAPEDYSRATPLGPLYAETLWTNPTLAGLVSTINAVRGRFVFLEYGGVATIGWDFEIDAKVESAL